MATQAPTVQTLDQIMASLQPGYAGQQSVINKKIANTDATFQADKLALDAAKTQGFNTINAQATGKGNTFSGIPIDEQANYLSTTYLPGVQKATAQRNSDILALEGMAAELGTDQRKTALNLQGNQQSAANAWNLQERQLEASAAEKAKDREFTALQQQTEKPSLVANIRAYLNNYVNPETGTVPKKVWQTAVQMAYESGMKFGGNTGFASSFWSYADDSKWQDYKIGYDKYLN